MHYSNRLHIKVPWLIREFQKLFPVYPTTACTNSAFTKHGVILPPWKSIDDSELYKSSKLQYYIYLLVEIALPWSYISVLDSLESRKYAKDIRRYVYRILN